MREFLRRRGPTVIAVAVAFIAGSGVAVTAQNLITSADIKDGAVKRVDLAKNAVNSPKIADGQVKRADLANSAVNSAKVADGGIARADLANGAVNSAKIADGGVARADLANGAVNSAKIADGGVATADLAANAVNSSKIANGSVAAADLASNSVNSSKVVDASITSADIAQGTIQLGDINAAAQDALTAYSGGNWGIIDRNVVGNGDSYLRSGPVGGDIPDIPAVSPPLGVGSVGLRTDTGDKTAFGNQIDFLGDPVSGLTAVGMSMYTTQENIAESPNNVVNIAIEIDASLDTVGDLVDFTTMTFVPPAPLAQGWRDHDAVAEGLWGLSGADFAGTTCDLNGPLCTWTQLMTYLASDGDNDAVIFTVGFAKGTDFAFSGAADALRINDTVYDFEPNGVFATPAP